ncbi:hypothetical protein SLA2020_356830 [Shorea laevis]
MHILNAGSMEFGDETLFMTHIGNDILLKQNRPALIVSSTSWTPDEDFGILLEAAVMYDRHVAAISNESDSTDEGVLWKEISDGKQLLYDCIQGYCLSLQAKDLKRKNMGRR